LRRTSRVADHAGTPYGVLALVAGAAMLRAEFDANKYPKGVKINDAELPAANLTRHAFHGEWNYTISPARGAPYSSPEIE